MGISLGEQAVQIIIKHISYEVNVLDGPDHDDTAHAMLRIAVCYLQTRLSTSGSSVHLNFHSVRSGRDGMRDSIATTT